MRISVIKVETVRPSITTRAMGAWTSPPSPWPSAIGIIASTVVSVVMRIGRSRVRPACSTACRRGRPSRRRRRFMESNRTMALLTTMPASMITPMKAWILKVVLERKSISTTPIAATGTETNHQRIAERLELGGHHHVDQDDREHQAEQEATKGLLLLLVLSSVDEREVTRQCPSAKAGVDVAHDASQVPIGDIGADLDHPLLVPALDLDRTLPPLHANQARDGNGPPGRTHRGRGAAAGASLKPTGAEIRLQLVERSTAPALVREAIEFCQGGENLSLHRSLRMLESDGVALLPLPLKDSAAN
jgi:hypothetical protein